jgi:hypothetical protein
MSNCTGRERGPRRPWPRRARAAAAVTVIAAAALLTQACSSSPASAGSALRYSQCMRSHAVPEFPDPVNGDPPKVTSGQQVGVTDARLSTAKAACQYLWPNQGGTAPAEPGKRPAS